MSCISHSFVPPFVTQYVRGWLLYVVYVQSRDMGPDWLKCSNIAQGLKEKADTVHKSFVNGFVMSSDSPQSLSKCLASDTG